MGRTAARGRIFPQFFTTDRRIGRLSPNAVSLFPFLWTNADDQGRLGVLDLEEIKYSCCPTLDHITKADIPELIDDLVNNELIILYQVSKYYVIQMIDWWRAHLKLQWPQPSDYPPPDGWTDHMRYKKDAKTVITINWPVSGENSGEVSGENPINSQVKREISSGENTPDGSGGLSGENSGESAGKSPLTSPFFKEEEEEEESRGRGRGSSPESSAEEPDSTSFSDEENSSPSHTVSTDKLMKRLTKCFRMEWGRVPADNPDEVIPREPDARINAQLRDLAQELSDSGGCSLDIIDQAFQEAAAHQKMYVSYVRKVLLDWLGIKDQKK